MVEKDLVQILVSMVIPELVFFQVQREVVRVHPMAFGEHLLCKTPEAFNAVDMGAAIGKHLPMIDRKVFAEAVQVIVAHEVICVEDRPFDGMVTDLAHQSFFGTVGNRDGIDPAFSLQKAENSHFSRRSASAMPFAMATEVRLVHFDLTDQLAVFGGGQASQRLPEPTKGRMDRWIGDPGVFSGAVRAGLENKGPQERPLLALLEITDLPSTPRTLPLSKRAFMGGFVTAPAKLSD